MPFYERIRIFEHLKLQLTLHSFVRSQHEWVKTLLSLSALIFIIITGNLWSLPACTGLPLPAHIQPHLNCQTHPFSVHIAIIMVGGCLCRGVSAVWLKHFTVWLISSSGQKTARGKTNTHIHTRTLGFFKWYKTVNFLWSLETLC